MVNKTDAEPATIEQVAVLIAGGGPAGLALALELEHHGIKAIVVERNPDTTRHPKMDITNGRSDAAPTPQRVGAQHRYPHLHHPVERQPTTLRLDQDRRSNTDGSYCTRINDLRTLAGLLEVGH